MTEELCFNKYSFISSNGMTIEERRIQHITNRARKELEKISENNNICPMCGIEKYDIHYRRMNTAYIEDDSNYITVCKDCFDEVEGIWKERWQEYYAGVL